MFEDNKFDVTYRYAQVSDAQSLVEINLNVWRTTYKNLISSETIEARFLTYAKRVEKTIDQITNNNTYIVAEIDNKVIGFVQYIPSKSEYFKQDGEIQALYICDEYHRKGIGTALFNLAIIALKELGYKQVVIDCLIGNPANEFYLKMGTSIHSIKEEHFMNEILIENVHILRLI